MALAAALAAASLASADAVDRVPVPRTASSPTKDFPPGVALVLRSSAAYVRASVDGMRGTWSGPQYRASGNPGEGGPTSIAWSVEFDAESKTPLEAVNRAVRRNWPLDIRGGMSVNHVIGGRIVGTMLGEYVLRQSPAPENASYEAALAFPIAARIHAVLRLELRGPPGDAAGQWGTYIVGTLPASLWNRGQAFWALASTELHGNLPPTRVVARAGGGTIRGTVGDAFRHPVVGATVTIERRAGSSWRAVTSTRTNARGAYVARGVARGRYRAVARVGTLVVRSASVVARR